MSIGRPTHVGNGLACTIDLVDGTTLRVTTHCVDRFWERVVAGSARFHDAANKLITLAAQVGEYAENPAWYPPIEGDYVSLGPDFGLIVRGDVAVTCISRGGYMSDTRRERQNERKREKKRKKAWKRGK